MRKVLVTGAGGLIGRRALAALTGRGFEVVGVGRSPAPPGLAIAWRRVDLLARGEAAALMESERPTHLLHLAWQTAHGAFWTSPDNLDWSLATLELMRAFASAGGKRFVGAGSCAEYDWSYGFMSESLTPRVPATPFGRFKNAAGEAVCAFGQVGGVSTAWGRVFFLYGPGESDRRLIAHVARRLLRGQPAETSHGLQMRDYSHVDDVAGGLAALVDCEVAGAVNVASGAAPSVREIVRILARLTNGGHLLRFGAIEPPKDDPPLIVADVRRLRLEVGHTPRFDLESGLAEALAAWREASQ